MNEIKEQDILETINNAKIDARYVLDNKYPINGIGHVLGIWVISYMLSSLVLYMLSQYALTNPEEIFFHYTRVANICLFSSTIVIYFIATVKTRMTIKEKDFLKLFSCFIIVFALLRMLIPITYYINADVLLQIYDSIPFDMIISSLAFIFLHNYSHQKHLLGIIAINIFYLGFYIWSTTMFLNTPHPSDFLVFVQEWNILLRTDGIMIIVLFLMTVIILQIQKERDDKYD